MTNNAYDQIATPGYTTTNGLPFYTISTHVGSGLYTPGGLIENTALRERISAPTVHRPPLIMARSIAVTAI